MTSSEVDEEDVLSRRASRQRGGGFHQKNLLGLMFRLNITADDDLIHKAHYSSVEMLIVSWVTNNCRQYV